MYAIELPEIVDDNAIHQLTLAPSRYVLAAEPAGWGLETELAITVHGIFVQNLNAVCLQWSRADKQVPDGAFEPEPLGSWSASNIEEVELQWWGKKR